MQWRAATNRGVYHSVMWIPRDGTSGMVINLPLPGGGTVRMVDKGLHLKALDSAGRTLVELRRTSAKPELGV